MPPNNKVFSERNRPQPATLVYEIPAHVRSRVLHVFITLPQLTMLRNVFWPEMGLRCIGLYGGLFGTTEIRLGETPDERRVIEHATTCTDAQFLDFIELCFQYPRLMARQPLVDEINEIFTAEGVGYAFSPFVTRMVELKPPAEGTGNPPLGTTIRVTPKDPPRIPGRTSSGGTKLPPRPVYHEVIDSYPMAMMKSNELLHSTTVMPALHLLTDPRFRTADGEMLNAHKHFRDGDHGAAINACGQAFESAIKTILTAKNIPYDPTKDVLSRLIEIGRQNNLFPEYYVEEFKLVGSIRNKLGSHGGGPLLPHGKPDERHVEHHLQITAAHILLLVRLSNI